jgi:hypothetical protein
MCCGSQQASQTLTIHVRGHDQVLPSSNQLPEIENFQETDGQLVDALQVMENYAEVAIGKQLSGPQLFSMDFSPCVPLVVFREDPQQTTLRHCLSVLSTSDLEKVLLEPGTVRQVVVVARLIDVCRLGYQQKQIHGKSVLQDFARLHPRIAFEWRRMRTDSTMHVQVDGENSSLSVSTVRPL